jgi:hypothetical protein
MNVADKEFIKAADKGLLLRILQQLLASPSGECGPRWNVIAGDGAVGALVEVLLWSLELLDRERELWGIAIVRKHHGNCDGSGTGVVSAEGTGMVQLLCMNMN